MVDGQSRSVMMRIFALFMLEKTGKPPLELFSHRQMTSCGPPRDAMLPYKRFKPKSARFFKSKLEDFLHL